MNFLIRLLAVVGSLTGLLISSSSLLAEDFIDFDDLIDFDEMVDNDSGAPEAEIADPFEGINRVIFSFNDGAYKKVIQPFTRQYVRIVPIEGRKGIANFFDNLGYPVRLAGSVLQLKLGRATQETGKFLVNTTAGMAGFMDAAQDFDGLNPEQEDIGQALGSWGLKHGFYIVLPLAGPSSLRDFVGRIGEGAVDPISEPWSQVDDSQARVALQAVDTVNDLPEIIDIYSSITNSAIDPYIAVRDGYAQLRAVQVSK